MNKFFLLCCLFCLSVGSYAQTRYDYYYLEAEKCRLADDYASAFELYKHCLEICPDSPEALYNLSLIQFYLRQDSVGISMLQRACEQDTLNPWYLESLASVYLSQRNQEKAIPVLERMSTLQTRRSDILSQLASMYKAMGKGQKAIDVLNRIELLEGKSAQLSIEKYALYYDIGERDSAFSELQSLCDEFPHDMNYKVLVGNQYMQTGEIEKAKAIYDQVLSVEPNNIHLLLSLLSYYEETKQQESYTHLRDSLLYDSGSSSELRVALMRDFIDKSQRDSTLKAPMLKAFDYLLAQPQTDPQMLSLRAAYLMYVKAPQKEIMQVMEKILAVDPSNELAMSQLLQYYASLNDYRAMEDLCRRGVNSHPEELGYHFYLGVALSQQDKHQQAIDVFEQGLRTRTEDAQPSVVSDMFSLMGDEYFHQRMTAEAYAAYDSALVYQPDNISCLNNYAYYLSISNQQLDKAEEMSYRTIKAEPNNRTYLDTYAWILFIKKEYTEARLYIDRVVSPEASDEELLADAELSTALLEHAGDIYFQCGIHDRALHLWQLAKKMGGTDSGLLSKKIKQKKYIK